MSSLSTGTFGNLQSYLEGPPNNVSVLFFENCTECPNCSIEQLGADLAVFLNSLPVPQVDVVAHSMGGLIVRSYLSGKQSVSGVFSPPATPKIRKAVFVATPHFGSFIADSLLADVFLFAGVQTNEMKRASQFLWDLATWNQFGDDLRGVDAVSVVGNAGPSQQGDGVVYSTSASLDFAIRGRTRVVDYCHIPFDSFGGLVGCNEPGIAYVDSTSHSTYQIVSSFLMNSTGWASVGTAPAQDAYLSQYGGIVVADMNASDQYVVPSSVSWGTVKLASGAASELYYVDFVSGTGNFNFGTSTCGPYSETAGVYSAVRCKSSPSIHSIGPLFTGAGRVVQAGGTIAINGVGFGAQQCSTCKVTAANPTSTSLQVYSWSDTTITANFPASYGFGIATISVTAATGSDSVNILAAPIAVVNPTSTGNNFVPVTPCRLVDTRNAYGSFGGPSIIGDTSRNFAIPSASCGIPANATAYSLNVTVVPHRPLGYLTIWPTGQPQPLVSTLNSDGRIKANAAIVPPGSNGSVSVYVTNTTDVILDINGYFVSGGSSGELSLYTLTPCRIADTRNPDRLLGAPSLLSNSIRTFPILTSSCDVPSSAQAYSLNFTAVPPGPLGDT